MIKRREYRVWADNNPTTGAIEGIEEAYNGGRPPIEGLESLVRFCETGEKSHTSNADLLTKELLHYRVLDMFAQVQGRGKENNSVEKSNVPHLHYLVGALLFRTNRQCNWLFLRVMPA